MDYATAMRRYQSTSLVRWQGQFWRIQGLNKPAKTATLLLDGDYLIKDAPLEEISE